MVFRATPALLFGIEQDLDASVSSTPGWVLRLVFGLGFRLQASGWRLQASGLRMLCMATPALIPGIEQDLDASVSSTPGWVQRLVFGVWGLVFRVEGLMFGVWTQSGLGVCLGGSGTFDQENLDTSGSSTPGYA